MSVVEILIIGTLVACIGIVLAIAFKLSEPKYNAEVKFVGHRNQGFSFHSMEYTVVLTNKKTGESFKGNISRFPHIYKNEELYIRRECDKIYDGWVRNGSDYSL